MLITDKTRAGKKRLQCIKHLQNAWNHLFMRISDAVLTVSISFRNAYSIGSKHFWLYLEYDLCAADKKQCHTP